MTTVSGTVFLADDDMGMDGRLAVFQRDITNQRQKLHLLIQFHGRVVGLVVPIEPAQLDRRQGANGLEVRSGKLLLFGEFL